MEDDEKMKFRRKIKVKSDKISVNIDLKVNTKKDWYTKDESKEKFDNIFNEVINSLMDSFSYEEIKVKKG